MIITKQAVDIKRNFTGNGKEIVMSVDQAGKIASHLTENLYSNEIGSVVREYVSNGYDAAVDKVKAKFIADSKTEYYTERVIDKGGIMKVVYDLTPLGLRIAHEQMDAVHVKITKDAQGYCLIIRDFGMGMDAQAIDKYFTNFGETSKDATNDALGAYGIGSKAFNAYTDICYYSTVRDGVERNFAMVKTDALPVYEPLGETVTDVPNGTTVKMYINSGDINRFVSEFKAQLLYFPKVFFELEGYDFQSGKLYETDTFKYSDQEPLGELHCVLGVVAYPIDFNKVDIPYELRRVPIGIKLNVGDVGVTLSRESLKYTPQTKALLKRKVNKAIKDLIELYNKNNSSNYKSLLDYSNNFESGYCYVKFSDTASMFLRSESINWADKNLGVSLNPVTIDGYRGIDFTNFKKYGGFERLMDSTYVTHYITDVGRVAKVPTKHRRHAFYYSLDGSFSKLCNENAPIEHMYYDGSKLPIHVTRYVHSTNDKTVYLIHGAEVTKLRNGYLDSFAKAIGHDTKKESLKDYRSRAMRVYKKMREDMAGYFGNIQDIEVGADTIKELKTLYKVNKSSDGTTIKEVGTFTAYFFDWYRKVRANLNKNLHIETLDEYFEGKIVLYMLKGEQESDIAEVYRNYSFRDANKIECLAVSKRNLKYFEAMDNAYTYEEFMKTSIVKKAIASNNNKTLGSKILNESDRGIIKRVDDVLGTDFDTRYMELYRYGAENIPYAWLHRQTAEEFFTANPTLKDTKYLKECLEFTEILRTFEFLKYFNTSEEGCKDVIKEWMTCKGLDTKLIK